MKSRRGATELAGVLPIDKPAGLTSHDVIAALRTATGERRIGHSGTLDPMATGLLLVLVGRATRLERYLVGCDKRYDARIVFGKATDTLDAEGAVVETADVPPEVADPVHAQQILAGFIGPQGQMPPAYSSIKRDGVISHRLARAGGTPVLEPRQIVVNEASLLSISANGRAWDVSFSVSKGTYIRALARDIGLAAGTVAHLGALRRTRIGTIDVEAALSLEDAVAAGQARSLLEHMLDPVEVLGFPVVEVDPVSVKDGRALPAEDGAFADGALVSVVGEDALLGVYRAEGTQLIPEAVMVPGVER